MNYLSITFVGLLATSLTWSASASAATIEVKLAVPYSALVDPLIKEFDNDRGLADEQVNIVVLKMESSSGVLRALLKGQADLGLFSLDTFIENRHSEHPSLSSLMSQPFQFRSTQELFDVQDTAFGDAVFAEVNRANLFPLAFWNQGLSQIVAFSPVKSVADFKGLVIGGQSEAATNVFERLGADGVVVPTQDVLKALLTGKITGSEVSLFGAEETFKKVKGQALIAGFRPTVGMLAASFRFWDDAPEAKKRALARAALAASKRTRASILSLEETERSRVTNAGINFTRFEGETFDDLQKISNKSYSETQRDGDPNYALKILADAKASALRDGSKKKTDSSIRPPAPPVGTILAPSIYFATDRNDTHDHELKDRFGSKRLDRPEVTCGKIAYDSNLARRPGDPFVDDIGAKQDSNKVGIRDCASFLSAQTVQLGEPFLVFVHGYNTSFKDAIQRAIAHAEDIRFTGPVLVWSWPSDGTTQSYFYDEESASWSAPHFSELLNELLAPPRKTDIDILTHSMGARIALRALEGITRDSRNRVRSILFAAPDEDRSIFVQRIGTLKGANEGSIYSDATLYGSVNDSAILLSQLVHRGLRAGSGGANLLVLNEVESVDTSFVQPSSLFGHGYAFESQRILNDIRLVLIGRLRASDPRRGLQQRSKDGLPFWVIP